MDQKFFLKSKTILVNGAILAAVMLLGLVDAQADGGQFWFAEKYLPADWERLALILTTIGNLVLRYLTSNGIRIVPEKTPPQDPGAFNPFPRLFVPALLAVGLAGGIAHAKDPVLKITATDPKAPGQRLVIDARESIADRIEILVWAEGLQDGSSDLEEFQEAIDRLRELGIEVKVPPKPDGQAYMTKLALRGDRADVVVLDTTPGAHYRIDVVAFNADKGEERGGMATQRIERHIPGGPAPPPTPTPPGPSPPTPTPPGPEPQPPVPPTPNPEPTIPEGRFKVGRKVYDAARAVSSPNRGAEAKQIAQFLTSLAGDINSGKTRGIDQIRKALTGGMSSQFNAEQAAQWRGFGVFLAQLIYDLLTSGALGTWQDWVDLLKEIVAALQLL